MRQSLETGGDALDGVFIDGHGCELGLADANKGGHDKHGFGAEGVESLLVGSEVAEAQDNLGQSGGENRSRVVVTPQDKRCEILLSLKRLQ